MICSNGANLSFPQAFGISDAEYLDDAETIPNPDFQTNLWLVGIINAAPYLASSFLGCWLSDPLNNYFGRRGTIFFSAVFCLLSVLGSAVSQTWEQLFITRLLLGIGMGSKASTVPIYAAENVPAAIRGGVSVPSPFFPATTPLTPCPARDELADVDGLWHLPWILCELGRV